MNEVRRCRRCKRKRLDDEPPEVKLYKTCAKCRIIERQKKKSRKPLAEETMLYGMKQFQQQNQNANFVHDDIFMDDDIFYHKNKPQETPKPSQQQFSLYKFQSPQPSPQIQKHQPLAVVQPQSFQPQISQQQSQQSQRSQLRSIQPTINVSMPVENLNSIYQQPINCEICSAKLSSRDELSMSYKLCAECYTNPYERANVFDNFNEFLLSIQLNKYKGIDNFIFVKEIDKNFSNSLNPKNKSISNEKQFREFLLESMKVIYLEPTFASIGYKFNQISSNVNEISSSSLSNNFQNMKPVKCWYKCYKDNETKCNSDLYLNYNINLNLLIIKFNHQTHKISRDYPTEFIELVTNLVESLKKETDRKDLGYNFITAHLVYDKLFKQLSLFKTEIQNLIRSLNKEDFVNDFINIRQVIEKNEKEESAQSSEQRTSTNQDANKENAIVKDTAANGTIDNAESDQTEDSNNEIDSESNGAETTELLNESDSIESREGGSTDQYGQQEQQVQQEKLDQYHNHQDSQVHESQPQSQSKPEPNSVLPIQIQSEIKESTGENLDPVLKPE